MGYQMLLILLSVILFSTVFLGTFNGIFMHSEIVYTSAYRLQAQKIADYYFQRIDADLLVAQTDGSGTTNFGSVFNTYSNLQTSVTVDSIIYNVNIRAIPCNKYGGTSSPSTNYRLVNTTVNFMVNSADTLHVGTSANPLSKVYADNGMY